MLRIAALAGVVALVLTVLLRFDSNPLDLRSPKVESVSTLFDLMKNPQTSPNTIDVPAPSLAAADALAAKLSAQPLVAQALTLSSFIPEDQDRKLALIADADALLDPTLNPFDVKPPPSDAELVASFRATAAAIERGGGQEQRQKRRRCARRLAAALTALADGPAANRARATDALVPGLQTLLRQLSDSLTPQKVTLASMPADMKAEWMAKNGMARVQVFPKDTSNDPAALSAFSDQVLSVAPEATGAPISIRESGRTIVGAFVEAGVLSFIAIIILLALVLRRVGDVVLHPGAAGAGGASDPGQLRGAAHEAQFRQHHRPAAAAGHRRRLQHLFRGGVAGGGEELPAIQPDAGGDLFGPDHGVRLWHAVAQQASRHRQHGRIADDLAGLDAGDDAVRESRPCWARRRQSANGRMKS